ncbi:MAG: DNA-binding protein [Candidatus Thiothrix putei]|uniref:DNA-binding protein n=1 Tax=Candidatus Thiothrix putei TaxID=3080811 RepID=A0AA95HAE3_9GAMM|nr:MAG: DNA-binding protein [Candidatus Thiothrix putei]
MTTLPNNSQDNEIGQTSMQTDDLPNKRGRGRPKGATSSTLAEVRTQAAEEKRKIRDELTHKINQLRSQLEELDMNYKEEVRELREALRASEQREAFFRTALEDRLQVVAEHIHKSLTEWATAELEEGQITQRKRGRPRKTFK